MTVETVTSLPRLEARAATAHKGDFGHVLIVAGSRGMAGAAVLCGTAALRGGAGTVQIAVPDEVQPKVAEGQICCTAAGLSSNSDGQLAAHALAELLRLSERADILAVGPGLGRGASVRWVVRELLARCTKPIVLDADGVEALAPLAELAPLREGRATI